MRSLIVVGLLNGCVVGLACGDVCVVSSEKLVASDANSAALFGVDVDLDGTTLVVGASDNSTTVDNGGGLYVFTDSGSGWLETNRLESSDLDASDFVGYSVSVDGDTIAAGAWGDDGAGSLSGAVYLFERNAGGVGNWGQVVKLNAPGASANDVFGFDVSVSGDTLVVGAPLDNGAFIDQGSVTVYRRDREGAAGGWVFVTQIFAPDAGVDAQFGSSVAIDGETLVVGAIGDATMGNGAGAAYIFERDLGGMDSWGLRTKLLATTSGGGSQANDQFGFQVGIDQGRVVVGATKRDLDGVFAGAAYVFGRDVGGVDAWGQEAELIPSDAQSGQWFGNAVSVDGDRLVVGALNTTTGFEEDQAGQAYVFERDGGVWNEALVLTNEDRAMGDLFGSSVALAGDRLAVGARLDSEAGVDGGSVSMVVLDDCSGCQADFTGDGSLDIFDVFAFLDAFNAMDPAADFTGDGLYDIFDVFAFLDAFNGGCP